MFPSDVTLSKAREIEGVRAMFGETYPDPVRVVSIGMAVDKLISDVSTKDWWKYSIEFCRGTHVERIGEIKELTVLEESGIAKGIRRIVAVTGQDATEVRQIANNFERERLVRLERMSYSPENEKFIKETQAEFGKLTISLLNKKAFVKRKDTHKQQKETQKVQVNTAINLVNTHFEQNTTSTSFVAKISPNSSTKALSKAIKHVPHKNQDKSIYFISINITTGKVAHGCSVASDHKSKVDAGFEIAVNSLEKLQI